VVVTVTAPISLALDDLAAVLFTWNPPREDLAGDDTVRDLVAEAVVNWGCRRLEQDRSRLHERNALTCEETEYLAYCRHRAAAVFAAGTGTESASGTGVTTGVR
jgi:hypothetical protein